jgi:UDP-glucose 4-epimerase
MILIFGGTGSLGKKLIERFLPTDEVGIFSRDEAKHWTIKNEIAAGSLARRQNNLLSFIGDVRDKERIKNVLRFFRPDTIIIAAALKQVDTCEKSPSESVRTNLEGTQNIIDVVNETFSGENSPTRKILFVSTDKACAPVNVYGMCKALSERIVTSQVYTGHGSIKYIAVRYGNVLESRGSIIPLFKYQCEKSDTLTVTNPHMTRFVMTLDDSVNLIQNALMNGKCGETWIPQLPAMKIGDLAELFATQFDKQIKIIGSRPGEKMHEDLINLSESERTTRTDKHYIIAPACEIGTTKPFTYSSNDSVMTKIELNEFLTRLNIFDRPSSSFKGRSIEEIVTKQ